ncbi:MAG: HRDC domain-containing protein, partial [Myxococcota bacterium]
AADWQSGYVEQRRHKEAQLAQIGRYAERAVCRMRTLVEHFGDQEDDGAPCGICDVCAPGSCVTLRFNKPTPGDCEAMSQILKSLRGRNGQSTGRLHLDTFGESLERRLFERLLASLVRGGWLCLEGDEFEKDGQRIQYQRAFLTELSRGAHDEELSGLGMVDPPKTRRASTPRKGAKRPGAKRSRPAGRARPSTSGGASRTRRKSRNAASERSPIEAPAALVDALKRWRLAKAQKRRIPAFRILSDRTLMAIAVETPRDEQSLLAISGIGPTRMRKYGREILEITRS